jgi:hydrogenase maturation protease
MMGDDGIGQAVVERLNRIGPPVGVRVKGLAGDVVGLIDLWEGEPNVWIVDAVSSGASAGVIQIFSHRELLALSAESHSIHHMSLSENLRWLLHGRPEMAAIDFRLFGIEVQSPRPEIGLSKVVNDAVDYLTEALIAAARYQPLVQR